MSQQTKQEITHSANQSTDTDETAERVLARIDQLESDERDNRIVSMDSRREVLDELMQLHKVLATENRATAERAKLAFLLTLRDVPEILENVTYRNFIADNIEQEDFYRLHWDNVEEVITLAEVLYGFRFQDQLAPDQVTEYVRDVIRHALRQFEHREEYEEMFQLLQRAPLPHSMLDAELVRVRNRLQLYEVRRVDSRRRLLYAFLAVQSLLVFLIFPLLFIQFENGRIQQEIEEATNLEMEEEPRQHLSFYDGLYWSLITSGSIGYGDISPLTRGGKVLASIAGILGVLTTGVVAGLLLNWVTPRQLR